jgi:hypothetical protein
MQDVFDDNARENLVVVSEAQILEYGLQTLKTPNRKHDGRDIRWQIVSEHRSLVLMDQKGIKFKRDIECFSEAWSTSILPPSTLEYRRVWTMSTTAKASI